VILRDRDGCAQSPKRPINAALLPFIVLVLVVVLVLGYWLRFFIRHSAFSIGSLASPPSVL